MTKNDFLDGWLVPILHVGSKCWQHDIQGSNARACQEAGPSKQGLQWCLEPVAIYCHSRQLSTFQQEALKFDDDSAVLGDNHYAGDYEWKNHYQAALNDFIITLL